MSRDKTRSQAKVRNVADGEIAPRHKNISHKNKYHYAPQSVRQKRALDFISVSNSGKEQKGMSACRMKRIDDMLAYREYMDQQAEKANFADDSRTILLLSTGFSIIMMGLFSNHIWFILFLFPLGIMFLNYERCANAFYALKLRGGSSLTPRGKGAKR